MYASYVKKKKEKKKGKAVAKAQQQQRSSCHNKNKTKRTTNTHPRIVAAEFDAVSAVEAVVVTIAHVLS